MAHAQDEIVTVPRLSTRPQRVGQPLLDGQLYTTRFTFNVRDRRWYLQLGTAAGEVIAEVGRITSGSSLLAAIETDPRCPPGQLFAEDARGLGEAPGELTCWTDWATLYYRPAALRAELAGTDAEVF